MSREIGTAGPATGVSPSSLQAIIAEATEREALWNGHERSFNALAFHFGCIAFVMVLALIIMPGPVGLVAAAGAMMWAGVGMAVASSAEAEYCRGWARQWRSLRCDAHASLPEAA